MGVDYWRFHLESTAPDLASLITAQATAFQSMNGWHCQAASDVSDTLHALQQAVHLPVYLETTKTIQSRVVLAEYDEVDECAVDGLPVDVCFRTKPVTYNPIFPPLWRVQAYRTFLPDELGRQLEIWETWLDEIRRGEHEEYLRWLHLHDVTDFLHYHWQYLRGYAIASLEKQVKWANAPKINRVREEIIRLPEPEVFPAPITLADCKEKLSADAAHNVFTLLETVNRLTGEWNSHAKKSWRIPDYSSNYHTTLESFVKQADNDWLRELLDWGHACVGHQFGWFLCG